MTYVLIAVVVIALVVAAVFTIKRNNAIQKNGIEADAVVSRIEDQETENDGRREVNYIYYVQYQTQDGKTVEAKLGNEPAHLFVGSKLRIKYLPDKPKYVIPAK
ncbi:MAG: hypothetical protein IJV64_09110 [Oscillospiraceae bacterium]|nr:hypothetical protein [Oscillospiraceae bacterium]